MKDLNLELTITATAKRADGTVFNSHTTTSGYTQVSPAAFQAMQRSLVQAVNEHTDRCLKLGDANVAAATAGK